MSELALRRRCLSVVELQKVFDPGIDEAVEIEEEKVAHVVQKLMDLDELLPRSSWAHLLFFLTASVPRALSDEV